MSGSAHADAIRSRSCHHTVRQLLRDDDAVRSWFGAGMLDHVVAALGLVDIGEPWAHVLSAR